jgi:hypothetical protein
VSGDVICRACGERRSVTVGDVLTERQVRKIFESVSLRYPRLTLAGVRHPSIASLEQGVGGLSERKRANRLARVGSAIALVEEVEEVIGENLRRRWGWDGKLDASEGGTGHDTSGDRAVAALDRVLARARSFEEAWEREGRTREALTDTPWDCAGQDLARELSLLAGEREFLQVARTLLEARTEGGS